MSSITTSPGTSKSSTRIAQPRLHPISKLRRATVSTVPTTRDRRSSTSVGISGDGVNKTSRTTKTAQKHVLLPTEIQTRPIPPSDEDETFGRSRGERMTKDQREQEGYRRLTAYCTAEGFKMKLLAAFLKREHAVSPRIYDEALYATYHLPLLPGYSQDANLRSSLPPKTPGGKTMLADMTDVEEVGYEDTYFAGEAAFTTDPEGFIPSSSPPKETKLRNRKKSKAVTVDVDSDQFLLEEMTAAVIFFQYGVVVFYGFDEEQERSILEDVAKAGTWINGRDEDNWEIEQCHYVYDPSVAYPRIYNDFFTLKSHSHLLKLSISHAIAQSTLLAAYESNAQSVLSHPSTVSIPRRLASAGALKLHRSEAMRLTGRLFKLRRDVNLVSNVLDTPELFWSEASLVDLYDAVREYFEISPRVQVLNEKLKVASDLLDIIHEHLNNGAMEHITWIIIWLIVVACLVEFTEVLARLIVDARRSSHGSGAATVVVQAATAVQPWRLMKRIVTPSPVRLISRIIDGSFGSRVVPAA